MLLLDTLEIYIQSSPIFFSKMGRIYFIKKAFENPKLSHFDKLKIYLKMDSF